MKKILSLVLVAGLLVSSIPSYAESQVSIKK
jgi:hypothetical protein